MRLKSLAQREQSLTAHYLSSGGEALAMHLPLHDPYTKTREAGLELSNETLLRGFVFQPGMKVLDMGCGLGGLAIRIARRHGVHVTGISICREHLNLASERAEEEGVGKLTEFIEMDFMKPAFPAESFDLILNQDSLRYAENVGSYLERVYELLRRGGEWRAVDVFLSSKEPDRTARRWMEELCAAWLIPPLRSAHEVMRAATKAGIGMRKRMNLSELAFPGAVQLAQKEAVSQARSGLEPVSEEQRILQQYWEGCSALSHALVSRFLGYELLIGRKDPTDA